MTQLSKLDLRGGDHAWGNAGFCGLGLGGMVDLQPLSSLSSLTWLSLEDTGMRTPELGVAVSHWLGCLTGLTHLNLRCNYLDSSALTTGGALEVVLPNFTRLRVLELSCNTFRPRWRPSYLSTHSASCQPGQGVFAALSRVPLEQLHLEDCEIVPHMPDLTAQMPRYTCLRVLQLGCHLKELGDECVSSLLAPALQQFSSLHRLDFAKNGIGCVGAAALAGALRNHTELYSLDVSQNSMGFAGLEHVFRLLATLPSLADLDVSRNAMCSSDRTLQAHEEAGLPSFWYRLTSASLRLSTSLRRLGLSRVYVGDAGMTSIASSLGQHRGLERFSAVTARVSGQGLLVLARALASLPLLREVYLAQDHSPAAGGHSLLRTVSVQEQEAVEGLLKHVDVVSVQFRLYF
jgi:hypothetical protein